MTANTPSSPDRSWYEACGLRHILRTLRLAAHPTQLVIGLIGIFLTLVLGGLLDFVRGRAYDGVQPTAITQFIEAKQFDRPYEETQGTEGVFKVWREHQKHAILGLLGSSLPGASVVEGTSVGKYIKKHSAAPPLSNLANFVYGLWWLARQHTVFAMFLWLGVLLIWSLAGGAICRASAVAFARDDRLGMGQAVAYARERLFGGFFLAPCIPAGVILVTMLLLIAGGMVLRIPILGDLIAGLAFGLAILGGFAIAALALGMAVGGSLFWPAVAVEGSDAFDAFSRGIAYPLTRPWKFLVYAVITVIYAGVCWVFANFFTFYVLKITRATVGIGSDWFGWWGHGEEGQTVHKIDALWPLSNVDSLYSLPHWQALAWYEWFSAALIGVTVMVVIGLLWSFLASFYYTGSTVVYFLMRRDVDGTELDDIQLDDGDGPDSQTGPDRAKVTKPDGETKPAGDEASSSTAEDAVLDGGSEGGVQSDDEPSGSTPSSGVS